MEIFDIAPVAQWIEQISPKNKIQVRLLSGARARGIEVTRDDGIAESGVQFPAGPPAVVAQVVERITENDEGAGARPAHGTKCET